MLWPWLASVIVTVLSAAILKAVGACNALGVYAVNSGFLIVRVFASINSGGFELTPHWIDNVVALDFAYKSISFLPAFNEKMTPLIVNLPATSAVISVCIW